MLVPLNRLRGASFSLPFSSLPSADEAADIDPEVVHDKHRNLVEEEQLQNTLKLLAKARFRTRARVEPILQEMDEYLDTFNASED